METDPIQSIPRDDPDSDKEMRDDRYIICSKCGVRIQGSYRSIDGAKYHIGCGVEDYLGLNSKTTTEQKRS